MYKMSIKYEDLMPLKSFIGRKQELKRLEAIYRKKTPNLVVIKGRRRVGKSRLINHFATEISKNRLWDFAGLAPQSSMSEQTQKDHFSRQFGTHLGLPPFSFND